MGLFDVSAYREVKPLFVEKFTDSADKTIAHLNKQWDAIDAVASTLKNKEALDFERHKNLELFQKHKSDIDAISNNVGNLTTGQARRAVIEKASEYANDPYLNAINQSYLNATESKELNSKDAKRASNTNAAHLFNLNKFQHETGGSRPNNIFQKYVAPEERNFTDVENNIGNHFASNGWTKKEDDDTGDEKWIKQTSRGAEYVSEDEVRKVALTNTLNDADFMQQEGLKYYESSYPRLVAQYMKDGKSPQEAERQAHFDLTTTRTVPLIGIENGKQVKIGEITGTPMEIAAKQSAEKLANAAAIKFGYKKTSNADELQANPYTLKGAGEDEGSQQQDYLVETGSRIKNTDLEASEKETYEQKGSAASDYSNAKILGNATKTAVGNTLKALANMGIGTLNVLGASDPMMNNKPISFYELAKWKPIQENKEALDKVTSELKNKAIFLNIDKSFWKSYADNARLGSEIDKVMAKQATMPITIELKENQRKNIKKDILNEGLHRTRIIYTKNGVDHEATLADVLENPDNYNQLTYGLVDDRGNSIKKETPLSVKKEALLKQLDIQNLDSHTNGEGKTRLVAKVALGNSIVKLEMPNSLSSSFLDYTTVNEAMDNPRKWSNVIKGGVAHPNRIISTSVGSFIYAPAPNDENGGYFLPLDNSGKIKKTIKELTPEERNYLNGHSFTEAFLRHGVQEARNSGYQSFNLIADKPYNKYEKEYPSDAPEETE